jgi:hypothetical protein
MHIFARYIAQDKYCIQHEGQTGKAIVSFCRYTEIKNLTFNFYSLPNTNIMVIKSRKIRWAGHVAHMGDTRNPYKILVGKTEEKRSLGIPRRKGEGNMKMDLGDVGWEGVDWIHLAQNGTSGGFLLTR